MNLKLRRARLERLWTIALAAEKVGVSLQTYSRWERGVQQPHLTSLRTLCEVFGKSPEELGFGDRLH